MFHKMKQQAKEKFDQTFHKDKYKEMHDESEQGNDIEKNSKHSEPMVIPKSPAASSKQILEQDAVEAKKGTKSEVASTPKSKDVSPLKPEKPGVFSRFKNTLGEAEEYVSKKVDQAQASVKKQLDKVDKQIKDIILKQKESLNNWIAHKVDDKVISIMGSMEGKISASVQKSVPYDWMQNIANDSVIHLWKDLTDLVRFELRVNIAEPKLEMKIKPFRKSLLNKFRNWVVYSLYPADLTQRDHMRRISFFVMKGLQFIPYLGIQTLAFLLIFFCIDKGEQYQLINFIVEVKSLQFFTIGLLGTILGYFHYFLLREGPGEHHHLLVVLVGYLIQFILIWVCYALLRKSESKASFITAHLSKTLQDSHEDKGGRIRYFLIYDTLMLFLSIGVGLLCYYFLYDQPRMQLVGDIVYFGRTIYGLLSFPFSIFALSFFVRLMTTAVPTGYDRHGNTIPMINTLHTHYKELPFTKLKPIDIEEVIKEN